MNYLRLIFFFMSCTKFFICVGPPCATIMGRTRLFKVDSFIRLIFHSLILKIKLSMYLRKKGNLVNEKIISYLLSLICIPTKIKIISLMYS
jgi:hypothetical protein